MEILNILDIGSPAVKTLKSCSFFEEKKIYSLAGRNCFIFSQSHGKMTILATASRKKKRVFYGQADRKH